MHGSYKESCCKTAATRREVVVVTLEVVEVMVVSAVEFIPKGVRKISFQKK